MTQRSDITRLHIRAAYCEQLGRTLDIMQVRQAFLDQPPPRRRFTFRCSDDACRRDCDPVVVGAAYDHDEHEERAVRPYFRVEGLHSEECEWVERTVAELQEAAQRGAATDMTPDGDPLNRFRRSLKETEIVDVFVASPPQRAALESEDRTAAFEDRRIRDEPSRERRIAHYRSTLRRPVRSAAFAEVVTSFLRLSPEGRTQAQLRIDKLPARSYAESFIDVREQPPWKAPPTPQIYYGPVHVWEGRARFILYFANTRTRIEIEHGELAEYPHGERLARRLRPMSGERLRQPARDAASCPVAFFFGRIVPSDTKEGKQRWRAELATLDYMDVRDASDTDGRTHRGEEPATAG